MQTTLFDLRDSAFLPSGFRYQEEAITVADEARLVHEFTTLPFTEFQFGAFQGKRRVVSFGWRYDYSEQRALPADPIPPFLAETYRRIQEATGFKLTNLEQALVTEYFPGTAIGWHKDKPMFKEVLGISLASECVFRLRKRVETKWQRVNIHALPRSSYFFEGKARWDWEHSIPPVEALRYSITFRSLRKDL